MSQQNPQNPFSAWMDINKSVMDAWGAWAAKAVPPTAGGQPSIIPDLGSLNAYYDVFLKSLAQNPMLSLLGNSAQSVNPANAVEQLYKQWQDNLKSMSTLIPNKSVKDGFDRFINSYQLMGGLQSLWDTFLKNIPKAATNLEAFSKHALKSYEDMISNFTQPFLPDALKNYSITSFENVSAIQNLLSEFFKPFLEKAGTVQTQLMKAAAGDKESYQQFLESWKEIYKNSFSKILNMPAVGSNRVTIEKVLKLLDYQVNFSVKLNEYNALIDNMLRSTMDKLLKHLVELQTEGKQPQTFLEFYKLWSDYNENAFTALYATNDFSKIMNETVSASSHLKIMFNDLWQDLLEPFPVVTKRDFDGVSEEVFNLRKRVKEQEKELKALKEQLATATAKPKA
jgi:class III poly(R)-hydroxyalkanoic acid synthase PhaE subunit